MAPDQRSKRRFFFFVHETIQQLLVRPRAGFSPLCEPPNVLEHSVDLPGGHNAELRAKQALGYYLPMLEPGGGKKCSNLLPLRGRLWRRQKNKKTRRTGC